ncbi:MAG TPA: isoprenylcysteine carboxylmethyltransferase family protein [Acidisarcina sp.]
MTLQLIWRVLYYSWFLSEVLIVLVTYTRGGRGKLSDRGSMLLLWVVIAGSITASGWIDGKMPHNMLAGAHGLGIVAVTLLATGLALRWTAVITLGRAFSVNVAVHDDQCVHKTGLFRFVRHPSYMAMMIIFLAIGLATRNWYCLAIMMVLPFSALVYRMHVEEAALISAFGEEYLAYSRVTKRLVPFVY